MERNDRPYIPGFDPDDVVVVSEKFHLRANRNNCIIYPFSTDEISSWRSVSACHGLALTLLDGKRTLREATAMLADLLRIETEKAHGMFRSLIALSYAEPDKRFLEKREGGNRGQRFTTYPPEEFVSRLEAEPSTKSDEADRLAAPLSLMLMPSNVCSVDCVYCYAERRPVAPARHLTPRRWLDLIDEAHRFGIDVAIFSGGDPLTYLGIELLFERLVLRGFKFLVPTKTRVSSNRAKAFASIGMADSASIQISVDGLGCVVDAMMRRRGYGQRALDSIANLLEQGLTVRTNTVCVPMNLREVPRLLSELFRLGVRKSHVTAYGRSIYRHDDSLFLSGDEMFWLKEQVAELKTRLDWRDLTCGADILDYSHMTSRKKAAKWETRAHCSGGTTSLTIAPDGDVILCEQVPQTAPFVIGSVEKHSIAEIWNSDALKTFLNPPQERFHGTVCYDCEEFESCHKAYGRCFRDAFATYRSFYAPSPNCPRAPAGLRMS